MTVSVAWMALEEVGLAGGAYLGLYSLALVTGGGRRWQMAAEWRAMRCAAAARSGSHRD